ncbi:ArsR/SmtB family transcription factor [Oceanibaculum pacificum]|uniref:ArsR family transcriptional regulator n=1 Tax=Oceanibaculum pacificum TaxID=580166 RepID=A0A154WFM7_9PROT|nr:metalloregulator ArsR/SmtB family transcription factor [Oceanibaculum pacificum]KZD12331.1 ArsR family transcriptional regulator [Oceanibaculum pacificum]
MFQQNTRRASVVLKAMGNERRLLILHLLAAEGEKSVSELEKLVKLSQSALSQHLARLRRDGLVKTRRSAQTIFYSVSNAEVTTILETLYGLYGASEPVRTADAA